MESRKHSLLIVDDEKSSILALTNILGTEYTVYAAKNGSEAMEVAKNLLPDIILLDIIMPDVDGYEVITTLKNTEETKAIPVIFISSLCDATDEEKGLALGASDYISKPFSPAIVKLRVRNQIEMLNHIDTIKRLAMIDQVTGIFNRRGFEERMRLEWGRAIRNKTPLSALILDIDDLKKYNDSYGHQQGDMILRAVASVFVNEIKRVSDFVARLGGDEFVIILVDANSCGALAFAEHVRKNVERIKVPFHDGRTTNVTISIGINTQVPTLGSSMDQFLSDADDALYTAKKEGKNMVCRHDSFEE